MSDSRSANPSGLYITVESSRFDCAELRVGKVSGTLAISRVSPLDVEVVCLDGAGIDVEKVLGEDVSLVFTPDRLDGHPWAGIQRIHGMVSQVDDRISASRNQRAYRIRIMPRADRLSLTAAPEVFLGKSVPEMVTAKLASVNLLANTGEGADVFFHLDASYDPREFVVQYGETDLAFISRITEHLGISFFFRHDGDTDQMVFTDNPTGFGGDLVHLPFGASEDAQHVFELTAEHRMVPKGYAIHDYNYRTPHVAVLGTTKLDAGYAGDIVEYGAHAATAEAASYLAKVRAEERAAQQLNYVGTSSIPAMRPGLRVHLEPRGLDPLDPLDLLVVEVTHEGSQAHMSTGVPEAGTYRNTFRAIPLSRTYRPPRATPKPRIAGLIHGVIDPGAGGSTRVAQLDDQGRYRVRFLFDTSERAGQFSSHPVRMLQNHAGENYGTHYPLKPGTEVLVGFVDGDPDRPIIVGAASNPITPSPVNAASASIHRVRSVNGTTIDFT